MYRISGKDGRHSPPTAQVNHHFSLRTWALEKTTDGEVNSMQAKMVAPIDERCTALKLLHEVAKVVRLIWVIYAFYAALGHNATAICLHDQLILGLLLGGA